MPPTTALETSIRNSNPVRKVCTFISPCCADRGTWSPVWPRKRAVKPELIGIIECEHCSREYKVTLQESPPSVEAMTQTFTFEPTAFRPFADDEGQDAGDEAD